MVLIISISQNNFDLSNVFNSIVEKNILHDYDYVDLLTL